MVGVPDRRVLLRVPHAAPLHPLSPIAGPVRVPARVPLQLAAAPTMWHGAPTTHRRAWSYREARSGRDAHERYRKAPMDMPYANVRRDQL